MSANDIGSKSAPQISSDWPFVGGEIGSSRKIGCLFIDSAEPSEEESITLIAFVFITFLFFPFHFWLQKV